MKDLAYTVALAIGTVLILVAISILSVGYLWHIVKPTVEKTEAQYFDANISELYHLKN
jgi:hypothetical protein